MHPGRGRPQQLVAGGVPEAVVDGLEVVEVEEQQPDAAALAGRAVQGAFGEHEGLRAVGQLGEGVVRGLVGEVGLQLLALVEGGEHLRHRGVDDLPSGPGTGVRTTSQSSSPAAMASAWTCTRRRVSTAAARPWATTRTSVGPCSRTSTSSPAATERDCSARRPSGPAIAAGRRGSRRGSRRRPARTGRAAAAARGGPRRPGPAPRRRRRRPPGRAPRAGPRRGRPSPCRRRSARRGWSWRRGRWSPRARRRAAASSRTPPPRTSRRRWRGRSARRRRPRPAGRRPRPAGSPALDGVGVRDRAR